MDSVNGQVAFEYSSPPGLSNMSEAEEMAQSVKCLPCTWFDPEPKLGKGEQKLGDSACDSSTRERKIGYLARLA